MLNRINRKKIYIFILLLAFVIFYYGFGKPHILPWQKTVPLKMPVALAVTGENVFIVDDASDRILVTDKDGKVSKIILVSHLSSSFDKIKGIVADEDYIYILGYNVKFGSLQITKEHIEKYDYNGRHIKTLYENSPQRNTQRTYGRLSRIYLNGKTVIFTQISDNRKSATVYEISQNCGSKNFPNKITSFKSKEELFSAEYNQENKKFVCTDIFSKVYVKNADTNKIHTAKEERDYFASNGDIIVSALAEIRKKRGATECEKETIAGNIKAVEEKKESGIRLFFLRYLQNGVYVYNSTTQKLDILTELPISATVRTTSVLFWVSLLLLLVGAAKLLASVIRKGISPKAKTAVAIMFTIAVLVGFYGRTLSRVMSGQYKTRQNTLCRIMAQYIESDAQQFIYRTDRNNPREYCVSTANRKEINKLKEKITTLATDAGRGDLYCAIYLLGKDNRLYMLCDSHGFANSGFCLSKNWTNTLLRSSENLDLENHAEMSDKPDNESNELGISRQIALRDEKGKVSLVVACGSFLRHLRKRVIAMSFQTLVSVLAVLIGVFVFWTIIPLLNRKMKIYFANRHTNKEEAAMALVAPYFFIVYLLQKIDTVLFILVSAQLSGGSAAKLALPALFASVGAIVGTVLQLLLLRICKNKTIMVFSGVTTALSYLVTAFAVSKNALMIFVWAQFMKNLCMEGLVKTIIYKLSYGCSDKEMKREATISGVIGKNAGSILAIFAGGCIATMFDYTTVYFVSAVLAVLLTLLFATTYMDCEKDEKKKISFASLTSSLNLIGIIFRPEMLLFIVFILLLKTSASVYSDKIFPLFATASQISVLLLSNLTMFIKASTYFLTVKINRLMSKLNMTTSSLVVLFNIVTGLFFIAFWLNNAILWAIIILFAFDIIGDTSGTSCGLHVSSLGEKYAVSGADMIALTQIIYSLGGLVSSALVLLLAFGYENACLIIGIIYIICALIFRAVSNKNFSKPLKTH